MVTVLLLLCVTVLTLSPALTVIVCQWWQIKVMHQSIPAVPIPPRATGEHLHMLSSVPPGDPRGFDTHAFKRWMSLSGKTRPLSNVNVFKYKFSQF